MAQANPKQEVRTDPIATWHDIGPAIAADWLKRNTLNRPKKPQKIALYAADMKSDHWPVTGTPIQFGRSGRLLDGQNRLQAIIDSGATIRMLVVEGVDDGVFDVIDGGARRTASDVLVIEGYEGWVASCGATASRIALNLKQGRLPYAQTFSPQTVRRFVNDFPDLMDSVVFMESLPRRPAPMPHSAAAALHYFMAKRDPELADLLMTRLYRGDNMAAEDMILRLRNSLLGKAQQKAMNSAGDFTHAMGAVIRVWNARRGGRTITHIQNAFLRTGDAFPEIK
jgi:hypothetical protein